MSVISNECVVFSIGENINPNDEIFNFANFIRILDDLYEKEEEVALVKFIEKVNIQFELPELEEKVGEDLNEKIKKFFDIIFKKKNKKFKKVDYDEGIIKLLEETFNNSVNLNNLIQSKIFPESNRMPPNKKSNGYNSGLGNNSNTNEKNNITIPVARGYRNLKKKSMKKRKKKPKKPKTKKKGGANREDNHNLINYVQLGMLGITLLYGIYTAVRNKVCGDEPFDYYTDGESTDEEDYSADIIPLPILISQQEVITSKPHIPELGKFILTKDFRRTVSLVVLDPRKVIDINHIKKCVVKYTENEHYSKSYEKEALIYTKLKSTINEDVLSLYNSGMAAANNNNKAVFSFDSYNTIKFSLNLDFKENNYYLILEYNKNYITLEKYGNMLKRETDVNITEKLEEVLNYTYRVLLKLQNDYKFVHTDLKDDNIMVVINKDEDFMGDFNGVKFFDFDLSSIEKDEPIECYRYPGWQDLSHTKPVGFAKPVNKAYFILLDMWRLWLSLRETVDVVSKPREKELLIYKYRDDKGLQKYCYLKYPYFEGTSKHKLEYHIEGRKYLNFTFKSFDDLYKEEVKNEFEGLYIDSNKAWNKYWMSLKFIQKLYKRCIKPGLVKRSMSRVRTATRSLGTRKKKASSLFVKPGGSLNF